MTKYTGQCFCGAVELEVSAEPIVMAICHCTVCRAWSASPVNGVAAFPPESVNVTKGEEHLTSFAQSEGHDRTWCKKCGGHVYTDHTASYGFFDVYASVLKELKFIPVAHLNYVNTIMPMKDGLPKFKDFPANFGGSGEMVDE